MIHMIGGGGGRIKQGPLSLVGWVGMPLG